MQKKLELVLEYNDTISPKDIIRMLETIPEREVNWAVDFSVILLGELAKDIK